MIRFFRTAFGIILVSIVLAASFITFVIFIATKSHPQTTGTANVSGLSDSVQIYRNDYGIPHIIGKSDADVFFGIGYAHAQDRLWQMDIARRAGQGKLAEIFGKRALEFDIFMRAVSIDDIAAKLAKSISGESRTCLEAYTKGVNAYISAKQSKLPFEFDALGYKPELWTTADCLIVSRLMAWEMNESFWTDPVFGEIANKLGQDRAKELIPGYPEDAPVIVTSPSSAGDTTKSLSQSAEINKAVIHKISSSLAGFLDVGKNLNLFLKKEASGVGSNSWAIHKKRQGNSAVILANDPHLALSAPSRWYEAHLTSPTMNVVGMTIPGLPFVISGRNDNVAWGITNMMLDNCDFFIEKIDSLNKKKYILPDGASKKFVMVRDTFKMRDSTDAIIDFRYTDRSAVISDVHPYNNPGKFLNDSSTSTPNQYLQKYCLTFSWTGQFMSDDILAMYRLNKSKNWEQFQQALNGFTTPGLNFTYADKQGNIGIVPAGSVPIRNKCNPNFPNPAWDKEYLWQGVHPPSSLPRTYNPASGYVLSANNKTAKNLTYYLTSLWEPASRAIRINELLKEYDNYSVAEAGIMQIDVLSPYARQFVPMILPSLDSARTWMNANESAAIELLHHWDYTMDAEAVQPAIYTVFLEKMTRNTFSDELGETLFQEYAFLENIPCRKLMELMKDSNNYWFDDKRTPGTQTRNQIIVHSFKETVAELDKFYGGIPISEWKYGKLHQLTVSHLLGVEKPMNMIVNLGPYKVGGDNTTISNSEWEYREPFKQFLGASMRIVCDMEDSVVYAILPGGNSGQPLSRDYANQIQLWLNGGFIKIPVGRKPNASFSERLVLIPNEKEKK